MILINGKEVFSYTEKDEVPDMKEKILPAVQLLKDNNNYVCQIGYYNIEQKSFEENYI